MLSILTRQIAVEQSIARLAPDWRDCAEVVEHGERL
jgi:hypothetical protein